MNPEDLKKLSEWYLRILDLEDEINQFKVDHPEIKKAKKIFSKMVKELDVVRHQLREEWKYLKDE